jgi:Tol biopolymer transport system component
MKLSVSIALAMIVLTAAATAFADPPGMTSRVTIGSAGEQTTSSSSGASVSATGRFVAFTSTDSSLIAGDTNSSRDIFVRDRKRGTTQRITVDSSGTQANSHSAWPFLSATGRYVVFDSLATNLVPGDTNGLNDVFLHDRDTGTTERVSTSGSGIQGNGPSGEDAPTSVSADGRYVAFSSRASNLAPLDTDTQRDIFVKDRATGAIELVSVDTAGLPLTGVHSSPNISDDGRYVVFQSGLGIHVRDRQLGSTDFIEGGIWAGISPNGRFVAYTRYAVPQPNICDFSICGVVWLLDRHTGTSEQISFDHAQRSMTVPNQRVVSEDGRIVIFTSYSSDVVPGDLNDSADVFVYDRHRHTARLVSTDDAGQPGDRASHGESMSADGRLVGFSSASTNLVEGDSNSIRDVFVHDQRHRWRGDQ